eukprot:m.148762 g.148762  ORF g.148762 m.148762 type:complete len:51 (+) comp16141_c1_seq6:821-973(+)
MNSSKTHKLHKRIRRFSLKLTTDNRTQSPSKTERSLQQLIDDDGDDDIEK